MSKAFTNDVQNIGRIKVRYSHFVNMANTNAAVDARNNSHHIPVFFFVFSM